MRVSVDVPVLQLLKESFECLTVPRHILPLDRFLIVHDVAYEADPTLDNHEKAPATVAYALRPLLVLLVLRVENRLDNLEVTLSISGVHEAIALGIPVEKLVDHRALTAADQALLDQLINVDIARIILDCLIVVCVFAFARLHGLEEVGAELRHSEEARCD
mmetsp:Transcript_13133/g.17804  ORF Transcript_13133/g.17804 Transcript_13133/m.17804 type:complete len:161 (-) Transcript_13133:680-1162(-)